MLMDCILVVSGDISWDGMIAGSNLKPPDIAKFGTVSKGSDSQMVGFSAEIA
jgi:hypothetical protein